MTGRTWRARGSDSSPAFVTEFGQAIPVDVPLLALIAYAKGQQVDLSQKDRNDFRQLTKLLAETYGRTKR